MKRSVSAAIALAVFMLVLLSQVVSISTAQVSPLPNGAVSPLATLQPLLTPREVLAYDPHYRANPREITAHAVPYVDQNGDTIIEEQVIQQPHRDPMIAQKKAAKSQQGATVATPLTFQSPLNAPPYLVYLPMVRRDYPPSSAHLLAPRVFVIVYRGETATNDPVLLTNNLITNLNSGTKFHGVGSPSIAFTLTDGAVHTVWAYPPIRQDFGGYIDIATIYNQFNICSRVAANQIDEVWIYVDGKENGHFYSPMEFMVNGPYWTMLTTGPIDPPNCGRQITTMLLNFDRGDDCGLHSWAHSAEFSWLWYPSSGEESCDVTVPSGYNVWGANVTCGDRNDPIYGFMARPITDNVHIGVCGDTHYPPNTPVGGANGIYWDPMTYPSRCTNWQWGITSTVPISCGVWGCNEVGYHIWWLQQAPGLSNNSHDRNNQLRPNWFNFRLPLR